MLNKFEEAAGGEFGVGTALQYGSAEAIGEKFDGQVGVKACTGIKCIHSLIAGWANVTQMSLLNSGVCNDHRTCGGRTSRQPT